MIYLLLFVLIAESIVIFYLNGKNIVSPSFIACVIFAFSALVYALNYDYYDYDISSITVAVVALLIFCIFLGEFIINISAKKGEYVNIKKYKPLVLPKYVCVILTFIVFAIGVAYFHSVYMHSLKVGNTSGDVWSMAKYVRESGTYKKTFIISQGTVISECVLYFFIFSFFYNKAVTNKSFVRYLFIIAAYVPHILAADNRTNLLRAIIVSVIIIIFLLKQKSKWSRKNDFKIIFISVFSLALFMLLFRLLGYRTGTSQRNELWDNLVKYSSSGIVGLDKYLTGEMEFSNVVFGEMTFKNIYNILRSWGFAIPEMPNLDAFYFLKSSQSNIYTGLKGFIQDFGIIGASFALIFIGMIMSTILNSLRSNKTTYIKSVFFAYLFYPLAMISIDESMPAVLGITTVYMYFYMIVIKYCAVLVREKKYDSGDVSAFS